MFAFLVLQLHLCLSLTIWAVCNTYYEKKKMFGEKRMDFANFQKINILTSRIETSLLLDVPDIKISLHSGIPKKQISLYLVVPNNQVSLNFDVPNAINSKNY